MKHHNIIKSFLQELVCDPENFKPTKNFYHKTGINQKRCGQIFRGDKSPTIKELRDLSSYFGENISVITEKHQLKLFNH